MMLGLINFKKDKKFQKMDLQSRKTLKMENKYVLSPFLRQYISPTKDMAGYRLYEYTLLKYYFRFLLFCINVLYKEIMDRVKVYVDWKNLYVHLLNCFLSHVTTFTTLILVCNGNVS